VNENQIGTPRTTAQKAGDNLLSLADKVAAAGIEPMSLEDITKEIKSIKAQKENMKN
jgi:hypothetical protein